MNEHNEKILFILNPISGENKIRRRKIRYEIIQQLRKKKIEGEIKYSKYSGHSSLLTKEAINAGYKYIVVSGGDGSINEVAKELINTNIALGIIPCGSGNGLARALGLPFEIKKSIDMIKRKTTKFMDTISVNDVVAVSVAGIGFDATVAYSYSLKSQRGFLGYFRSVMEQYLTYKPEKIKILNDGKQYSAEIFSIVFANSNQFGFNFKIAPKASCFDALIDVTTIKPMPIIAAPFYTMRFFLGKTGKSIFINSFQCKEITIMREKPSIVNVDGNAVEMDNVIIVKIIEKSLRIISY